jgi:predicted RNA-binding Zn-ribbon protein involved in translation (DUF1610 family)
MISGVLVSENGALLCAEDFSARLMTCRDHPREYWCLDCRLERRVCPRCHEVGIEANRLLALVAR